MRRCWTGAGSEETGCRGLWIAVTLTSITVAAISGHPGGTSGASITSFPVKEKRFSEKDFAIRRSIDVAESVLSASRRRKKIVKKVETSANVFAESLHGTTKLDSTYYVTDTKQTTDFFWFRDSGVRINIGLQAIDLIPVYDDVMHKDGGDNEFITGNPSSVEEGVRFKSIVSRHCRTPLPDHYSLTMEISKDRTTRASLGVCSEAAFGQGRCPEGVDVGDRFLLRTLNEPCQLMESYPEPLVPAANSVVCTESGGDLLRLFNVTGSPERPIAVHSRTCRLSQYRCHRCIEKNHCHRIDDAFERRCCEIDCHSEAECKMAHSSECQNSVIECAMGDTYRYTLQPIFVDMETRFRCHLTRRKPSALFQLWFYVSVPGFDFETPKVNFTAASVSPSSTSSSLETSVQQQRFQFEFLSVEANAGITTREHLVLVGKELGNRSESFAVQPAAIAPAFGQSSAGGDATGPDRTVAQRQEISENIRVLLTKFARPFDYSTSSWGSADDDSGCRKDASKFATFGSFESESVEGEEVEEEEEEAVNVMKTKLGSAFEYLLKSKAKPPSLRLLIPGNVSMLRWWFRDQNVSLASDASSLRVRLSRSQDDSQSQIHVSGNLSGCPGYLSVIVTDRTSGDELLNYDVLVSCPSPEFNLTFYLPDSDDDDGDVTAGRVYELQVDDTKRVRRSLLVRRPARPRPCGTPSFAVETDRAFLALAAGAAPPGRRRATYEAPLAVATVALVCSFVVYVTVTSRATKNSRGRRSPSASARECTTTCDRRRSAAAGRCYRVQRLLVAVYVLTRFAYNVLAFSAFYVLLTVSFRRHFDRSAASVRQNSAKTEAVLYERLISEPFRHLRTSLARGGGGGCCDQAEQLFSVSLKDGASSQGHDSSSPSQVTRSRPAALKVAEIWNRSLARYRNEARKFLSDIQDRLGLVLKRNSRKFDRFVRSVLTNEWLMYPLRLFGVNASNAVLQQRREGGPSRWMSFSRDLEKMRQWELDFSVFLGIEEIPANEILNQEILNRCKDLGAVRFMESFQILAMNGFSCDSTDGSGGKEGQGQGQRQGQGQGQERSPKSLDSFDATRFYSSFDIFVNGDRIPSQGNGGLATPTTTPKRAQRRRRKRSPEIATESRKRPAPDLSGAFADAFGQKSTSCGRLLAILIALDFVVVIRRMFRLYEKFRSFQRCYDHDDPPSSKQNAAYSSCDLGGVGGGEGQGYPMTTTDLNHTGSGEAFHSISSKLGPDEETTIFDDAMTYNNRTRCGSIFDGKTGNNLEKEDAKYSQNFLETLFGGFLHESVVPEIVVTAFVIALLVTGVTVLSRRRDVFQMDDQFWTPIIELWKSWTNDAEEISQAMELEGNIRSELVYLDATIAHLCSGGNWRLASGLSHDQPLIPALCLLGNAATGDNATSDVSWEKKPSMTSQQIDNLDVLSNVARFECCDVIAGAVRVTLDLALTLIAVLTGLRSLSWTVELIVTRLCSSSSTSGHVTTERHVTSSSSTSASAASKWIDRTFGADDDDWCLHEVTYLQECCPCSVDGCAFPDHSDDGKTLPLPLAPHQHKPCCPPLPPATLGGRCCLAQRTRPRNDSSNAPNPPCEGSGYCNSHPRRHRPLSEECSASLGRHVGGSSTMGPPRQHHRPNPRASSVHLRRASSVGSLALRTPPPSQQQTIAATPSNRTAKRMSVDFYPLAHGSEANEDDDDNNRRRSRRGRSQKGVRFVQSSFSETIV